MTLQLHRCLPSPVALLPSRHHVAGTRTVQTLSQYRPSLVCRAAAPSSEGKDPAVFKDDSHGIVCFSDADGEIVCEGWDEGPHFQPEPEKGYTMRKRVGTRPGNARGGKAGGEAGEPAVGFKSTGTKLQESIKEVTAETSFNSSEL